MKTEANENKIHKLAIILQTIVGVIRGMPFRLILEKQNSTISH